MLRLDLGYSTYITLRYTTSSHTKSNNTLSIPPFSPPSLSGSQIQRLDKNPLPPTNSQQKKKRRKETTAANHATPPIRAETTLPPRARSPEFISHGLTSSLRKRALHFILIPRSRHSHRPYHRHSHRPANSTATTAAAAAAAIRQRCRRLKSQKRYSQHSHS